jgi:Xaa-Pro aminopeptidase
VTRDGSLSAHFEHSVVVTPDGCEILTLLPADAERVPELLGRAGSRTPSQV